MAQTELLARKFPNPANGSQRTFVSNFLRVNNKLFASLDLHIRQKINHHVRLKKFTKRNRLICSQSFSLDDFSVPE